MDKAPMSKERPLVKVDVPPEFAARFLAEEMLTARRSRPVHRLTLGDADLGAYQIVAVATEMTEAGYLVATATLMPVWER